MLPVHSNDRYPGWDEYDDAPQYHVRDLSCAMNDPAAVIYDPVHGMYYLKYVQVHLK